jgi:mannose-6-phosphate isomerase-like protein (cupin superfamily)
MPNSVARELIPVDDLNESISQLEAEGFRLVMITPADDPRQADLDSPTRRVRLDRTAASKTTIQVNTAPVVVPELVPELVVTNREGLAEGTGRAGMRYRDLIPSRLGGRFIASHISVPGAGPIPDYVHYHDVRFQMIFCHAGWVRVVYEDQGDSFVMRPGDCVIQPPGIRHRVLASGGDLQVVEIGCPAEHPTYREHTLELPTITTNHKRQWAGQTFVRHITGSNPPTAWRHRGFFCESFGISAATGGLAEGRSVWTTSESPFESKFESTVTEETFEYEYEFQFLFVRSGTLTIIGKDDKKEIHLSESESIVLPPLWPHRISASDATFLEVTLPA